VAVIGRPGPSASPSRPESVPVIAVLVDKRKLGIRFSTETPIMTWRAGDGGWRAFRGGRRMAR
jgi:hypothetical protein